MVKLKQRLELDMEQRTRSKLGKEYVKAVYCHPAYLTYMKSEDVKWSEVAQSCPTLCDPVDCSPPGSCIHGNLQARILEWVAISFSRGSSRPRDRTQDSCITGRCFNLWATREAHFNLCTAHYLFKQLFMIIAKISALLPFCFIHNDEEYIRSRCQNVN